MTDPTTTSAATPKKDKRYTFHGALTGLQSGTASNEQQSVFARFKLVRGDGKRDQRCVAWDQRATTILQSFAEGAKVEVWGFLKARKFTGREGNPITYKELVVLSIKAHEPKTAETPVEAPAADPFAA